eukprot:TRINITY_DN11980_c0_g1_i1.p1 TRINITY_DN11980_c0_g1~~TRINITY_DN11980_c0_g1_i1.p1  ORF type:complete len:310 (-),score=21.49 TRINITY_DN11980_c0_g1_i1:1756-2685(-)
MRAHHMVIALGIVILFLTVSVMFLAAHLPQHSQRHWHIDALELLLPPKLQDSIFPDRRGHHPVRHPSHRIHDIASHAHRGPHAAIHGETSSPCQPALSEVRAAEPASPTHCMARLPPVVMESPSALKLRAIALFESETSAFPFVTEAGYNISSESAAVVDAAVKARTAEGEKKPMCAASTYDGHGVDRLADLFLPGGAGALTVGDEVVDLGAGIAKVLAVVAMVSNSSARGIELSAERFKTGCDVLKKLEHVFNDPFAFNLGAHGPVAAPGCPQSRTIELWNGDLLEPPAELLRPPQVPDRGGSLTFFA